MMNSLKEFTENFVAEDAAILAASQASQQSLLESQQETEMPVTCSPYFTRPKVALSSASPEVVCIPSSDEETNPNLSDDGENIPKLQVQLNKVDATPTRPMSSRKKPFGTLGNANKLSMSQRKLAAQNGSQYFEAMNNTPAKPNSKLSP